MLKYAFAKYIQRRLQFYCEMCLQRIILKMFHLFIGILSTSKLIFKIPLVCIPMFSSVWALIFVILYFYLLLM